jgi:hypothetical protein
MLEEYLSEKQKKKRERERQLWGLAIIIAVFAVCLFATWIVTSSPIFHIDHFAVTGNHAVASGDIVTLLFASSGIHRTLLAASLGINNMLIWPQTIATSVVALVPQLSSVTLQKNYANHTLLAVATERVPLAIWCFMPKIDTNGNPLGDEFCYWFDDTGTLFQKAFDTEGSALFAVHDYAQSGLGLGGEILPDIFVPNMLSILDTVKASGLTVKEIALNDLTLEEIDVSTYNGPDIYFSLRFSAAEDLPVLQELMQKSNFASLQYVDFRTENRAYYK